MAQFRIEAIWDPAANAYYAEIFDKPDADVPFVRTRSRFRSQDEAMQEVMEILQKAFPDKPVRELKPS